MLIICIMLSLFVLLLPLRAPRRPQPESANEIAPRAFVLGALFLNLEKRFPFTADSEIGYRTTPIKNV